tara:strand:+ start:83 stop:421 length:339 start_codon:yes stop_codon:yes gene_type:complete
MAKKQNDQKIVYSFCEKMYEEITTRFGDYATVKDITYHYIEKGIVRPTEVRDYMIIYDYDHKLKENEGHITHTFMDLSIKYELSERHIENIVRNNRKKTKKTHNIKDKKKES